jgi:hypothetical protein
MRRFILGAQLEPLALIKVLDREKMSFRPSKRLRKFRTQKLLKIVSFQKIILSQLEYVGGHRCPPGSILPPSEAMVSIASSSRGRGESIY